MQSQKVSMNKRKFRIGDLAKEVGVKKFVIRFWEKEFDLKSDRSDGGQRFYTPDDLKTFMQIKELLYKQKFTIPGAKKQLSGTKKDFSEKQINLNLETEKVGTATKVNDEEIVASKPEIQNISPDFYNKLNSLKQKLIRFKELLK